MSETKINPERKAILNKIEECEKNGVWEVDPENDPPAIPLEANKIDYLSKNPFKKIMCKIVYKKAKKFVNELIDQKQIIIKEVIGAENLAKVKGGAFITSNHFHPFENLAISKIIEDSDANHRRIYRVIREGNYTNPPKGFDMFFKYCYTLPLSSKYETMKKFVKAVEVLSEKSFIMIYPEGHMWWNFKKPRPFKNGAFKFASKFDRPIIPCFITMEDSDVLDADGLPVQAYTIHIEKPIYPNIDLSMQERIEKLKNENFEICKNIYEKTYGIPLKYTCDEK